MILSSSAKQHCVLYKQLCSKTNNWCNASNVLHLREQWLVFNTWLIPFPLVNLNWSNCQNYRVHYPTCCYGIWLKFLARASDCDSNSYSHVLTKICKISRAEPFRLRPPFALPLLFMKNCAWIKFWHKQQLKQDTVHTHGSYLATPPAFDLYPSCHSTAGPPPYVDTYTIKGSSLAFTEVKRALTSAGRLDTQQA